MKRILLLFLLLPLFSFAQIDSFNTVYYNYIGLNHAKFTKKIRPIGNINLIQTKDIRVNALGTKKIIPDSYQYDQDDRLVLFKDITYNFSADLVYLTESLSISYGSTTVKESVVYGNPFSPGTYYKTELYEKQAILPFLYAASFYRSNTNQDWEPRTETYLEFEDDFKKVYKEYTVGSGSTTKVTEYIFEGDKMTRQIYDDNQLENRVSILMNAEFQMPELIQEETCDSNGCETIRLRTGVYDSGSNTGYVIKKDLSNTHSFIDSTFFNFTESKGIAYRAFFIVNNDDEIQLLSERHYSYNADDLLYTISKMPNPNLDSSDLAFYHFYNTTLVTQVQSPLLEGIQLTYSNPGSLDQSVQIKLEDQQKKYKLWLSDALGRVVYQKPIEGDQFIPFSSFNINAGNYYLTLERGGKIKTWRLSLF